MDALYIAVGIIGIVSPIVGWGLLIYKDGKGRGRMDAGIKTLVDDVSSIKKTLGNGGYTGLKGNIHNIQVNCAREMASVNEKVAGLMRKNNEATGK